jgi:hypothetical protein
MTAPDTTPTTHGTRDVRARAGRTGDGRGAATAGGVLGILLVGGLGVAIGVGLMELKYDPNAGLANLGLLVFPLGLGALGVLVGVFLGVRTALRRYRYDHDTLTAWLAVPLAAVCIGLVPAWGIGAALLPAVPAAARWLVLRQHDAARGPRSDRPSGG